MPDYSKGVIYTIRNKNDATKIYVGSTSQPLYKRFHQHKINCKKESNMNIKLYVEVANDWTNWYIELYENYSCNNKNELCKREGEVIREIGTLNNRIEGRDSKQYYIDNLYNQIPLDMLNKCFQFSWKEETAVFLLEILHLA